MTCPFKPGRRGREARLSTQGGTDGTERYRAQEVIGHLRILDIETGRGLGLAVASHKVGLTQQSCGMNFGMEISFSMPHESQFLVEQWRRQYNTHRPHRALGYWPPVPRNAHLRTYLGVTEL